MTVIPHPRTVTPVALANRNQRNRAKVKKAPPLDLQKFTEVPDETQATVLEGARPIPSRLSQPEIRENISNEERAQRFRVSGDLASTILYLRRAVDDKPDDIDLRRKLIKAYQDDNASEMAVAEIGRSLRLDAKNSALYRMYGDAEYASGNNAEAMKAFKQAMELDPKDVLARVALADMLQHDGQYDDAQQLYRDASGQCAHKPYASPQACHSSLPAGIVGPGSVRSGSGRS